MMHGEPNIVLSRGGSTNQGIVSPRLRQPGSDVLHMGMAAVVGTHTDDSASGSADRSSATSPSTSSSGFNQASTSSSHSSSGSFHVVSPQTQSFADLMERRQDDLLAQMDTSVQMPYDFGILAQSSHADPHSNLGMSAANSPSTWQQQQQQLQQAGFGEMPSVLSPSAASAHRLQSQDWEQAVLAEQQRQRQQHEQQQQLHNLDSFPDPQYTQSMIPLSPDSSAAATIDWASRLANATVADMTAYMMTPDLPLLSPNRHDMQLSPNGQSMQLLPNGQYGSAQEAAIANFLEDPHGENNSLKRQASDAEQLDWDDDLGGYQDSADGSKKSKSQRRQGVTCDQCRNKHLRCDLAERRATGALPSSMRSANGNATGSQTQEEFQATPCSPCAAKNIQCTKIQAPPSRRFPRPSRSGKRIEQARQIHGTLTASPTSLLLDPASSATTLSIWSTNTNDNLGRRVLGGSLSLRLLTCFFATSHMQMPVVEFDNFSARYNLSSGDPRLMSIMGNGGDALAGVADVKIPAPGLQFDYWPGSKDSTISSPGTTETLIATMQAWAAHYTDAPIAFGASAKELGLSPTSGSKGSPTVPNKVLSGTGDYFDNVVSGNAGASSVSGATAADGTKPRRRPKRKQGVACDTCRLRRVRCDITERPEGLGCSRCEDKRINCTDEYIQTKVKSKAKRGSAKKGGGDEVERINSVEGIAGVGLGPNSWHGRDLERESWRDAGPKAHLNYEEGRGKGMMDWGRARQAFCHELLCRALNLMHKHSLLHKPSVEGVQCLMLLVQLVERVDPVQAQLMSATACQHILALKLQARFEVDERDKDGVEKLLSQMQHTRVYLSTWTRDAIASGMLRQPARLLGERAVEVSSGGTPPAAEMPTMSSSQSSEGGFVGSALVPRSKVVPEASYPVELSGEMGLTFTIMALMQVGALSRFIAKHIDVVIPGSPPDLDPSKRFPSRPSVAQMRKLTKACHAVWDSIDALMIFFDRCTVQARDTMERLKPFQPLGWIATIKVAGAMLMLAIYRVLGERLRVNATYMAVAAQQARAFSDASLAPGPDDMEASRALRALFELSKQRTLTSSRRIAHLVHFLLPRQVFHTSGILLRQLFPVAQFLARTPPIDEAESGTNAAWLATAAAAGLPSTASASAGASHIDPTSLAFSEDGTSSSSTAAQAQNLGKEPQQLSPSSTLALPADTQPHLPGGDAPELGHFDAAARKREVGWCLEGLAQMGFAWPEVEGEVKSIEGLLDLM